MKKAIEILKRELNSIDNLKKAIEILEREEKEEEKINEEWGKMMNSPLMKRVLGKNT